MPKHSFTRFQLPSIDQVKATTHKVIFSRNYIASSLSAMLEKRLTHVTLVALPVGSGGCEVHRTQAPILSQTCLRGNDSHTSREVKIFRWPTKSRPTVRWPLLKITIFSVPTNLGPLRQIACSLVIVNG